MPVPYEALIPMGLVGVMFFVTGTGYNALARYRNDGKPIRHSIDEFESMMMKRDERLTGSMRGQATNPTAPKEFATNSAWNTERVL
ncbi:hypothetical protein BCV69DRAFT_313935 [Microstroma glucosiphilum]|uniref:NADH dehydrogenase [ubiquinone] 1 alpha subcomplex subunit 1 n=1 Tax=Pseudomicrostroma glucosiphilum TaxID=1684307 RepID=A0A316U1B5_9BASI|nr:hypothetical protein BCV69DRAFT_313935 [Pseudomicrostroma glucosiphilum]PWN19179.1 hypothetical protein BCV69DRAFT_313935 [Pseudomicrostroma glucosiphilum]